jgi:alanyl-tRNA synthetase
VLHWAIRDVLGDHAGQAGSLVDAGRLRFDFSHFGQVSEEDLADIEGEANRRLIANHNVTTVVTTKDQAQAMGALAFFGDKYGETVRVVQVGDFSTEFCGGTHTATSAQVGPLLVLGESSIGSNLRRVEALTGVTAYEHLVELRSALSSAGKLLRTGNPTEVPTRLEQVLTRIDGLEAELSAIEGQKRGSVVADLTDGATRIGDVTLVVGEVSDIEPTGLRQIALGARDRIGSPGVVIVGSRFDGKGALVAAITEDLEARGISASQLVADGAAELGGGSSRDPVLAQAGGPNGAQVGRALEISRETAERRLSEL